jgi:hypothetical protein
VRALAWHSTTAAVVIAAVTVTVSSQTPPTAHDSARYFALADVTPVNVASLVPAWTFHSGDFSGGKGPQPKGAVPGVQTRPVVSRIPLPHHALEHRHRDRRRDRQGAVAARSAGAAGETVLRRTSWRLDLACCRPRSRHHADDLLGHV